MSERFRRRKRVRAFAPHGAVRATRPRRGQSLVEFALVLPIFLVLLLMAVDFGRLFFTYIQVSNAAREAAAYGATQPTDSVGMQSRAVQEKNAQSQGEGPLDPIITQLCEPGRYDDRLQRGARRRRLRQHPHGHGPPAVHLPDAAHQRHVRRQLAHVGIGHDGCVRVGGRGDGRRSGGLRSAIECDVHHRRQRPRHHRQPGWLEA